MQPRDAQRIAHILQYCRDIETAIDRFGKDYSIFVSDKDYHDVIAFRILQIGELAGALSDDLRSLTAEDINWRQIKAMRNIVAHHYGKIELSIVWETATRDIPALKSFCEKLLADNPLSES